MLSNRLAFVVGALAMLAAACAGPSGSGPQISQQIDSPTTQWEGPRLRSDSRSDLVMTPPPTGQLQLVAWIGPFTIWLEPGNPLRVMPPSTPYTASGSVSVLLPGVLRTEQLPSDAASSTSQPETSLAATAPDGRDEENTPDVSAPMPGPDSPANDPLPTVVDGSTSTDDADGGTGDQRVVSDRCQDWQPRPGDELRPCMGGPQFVP